MQAVIIGLFLENIFNLLIPLSGLIRQNDCRFFFLLFFFIIFPENRLSERGLLLQVSKQVNFRDQ